MCYDCLKKKTRRHSNCSLRLFRRNVLLLQKLSQVNSCTDLLNDGTFLSSALHQTKKRARLILQLFFAPQLTLKRQFCLDLEINKEHFHWVVLKVPALVFLRNTNVENCLRNTDNTWPLETIAVYLIFHVKVHQEVLPDYLQETSAGCNSSSKNVYDTPLFNALFSVWKN